MKRAMVFVFLGIMAFSAMAQFSLEADIRPRAEFRRGYRMMPEEGQKPAGLVSQRTRLILDFASEQVTTRIAVNDVRIWGQQGMLVHEPSLDLHEAWVQVGFNNGLAMRAGRQEIVYDNERLFSNNDWNNSGQKHDALVFQYASPVGEFHLGGAFNQRTDRLFGTAYRFDQYKTLQYLRLKTTLAGKLDLSILAVADGHEHPGNAEMLHVRGTWSLYGGVNTGNGRLNFNPAYQHGKDRFGNDVDAFYGMVEVVSELSPVWTATLGAELFSGNNMEEQDGTNRAFDPLFASGHSLLGYMDYFTSLVVHTRGAGLVSPYLKNRFRISPDLFLDADLHVFSLQNNYVHNDETISKYLGTEVDLTLNYRFNDFTRFIFGYSVMFGSKSMEIIRGGSKDEFAHWGFVMLRLRPKFL